MAYYWQYPPRVEGHCLDEGKTTLAAGILTIIADLITTCVLLPLVMRLKLPLSKRIGVSVLFCLGLIVTIAGIVRTCYIWYDLKSSLTRLSYLLILDLCVMQERYSV